MNFAADAIFGFCNFELKTFRNLYFSELYCLEEFRYVIFFPEDLFVVISF